MEIPLSCGKVRRGNFPHNIHRACTYIWLYYDSCGDGDRTNDEKESGWSIQIIWKEEMAVVWRLDKCRYTCAYSAVLFGYRRLGHQISGGVFQRKCKAAG